VEKARNLASREPECPVGGGGQAVATEPSDVRPVARRPSWGTATFVTSGN